MKIILWILLVLFIGSMSVGGLVGGADIVNELFGRVDPSKAILVVNGKGISPDLFFSQVDQRLEQARIQGIEYDQGRIDNEREQVYNQIIQSYLIDEELKNRKININDDEVYFELVNNPPVEVKTIPEFMTDGKFDDAKYQLALQNPQGNEWQPIEDYIRQYLPRQKLFDEIRSQIVVSENEVKNEYIINNLDFTINALIINDKNFNKPIFEPSKKEVEDYYFLNPDEFKKEEERFLSYMIWEKIPSRNDTSLTFSTVDEILSRLKSGDKFETLANEFSEDPGNLSKNGDGRNGDLGWFGRGQMVKKFEEAAFNSNKDSITGPIETNFGIHIIKTRDKRKNDNNEDEVLASHILLKIDMGPSTRNSIKNNATQFTFDIEDYGINESLEKNSQIKLNKLPPLLKSSTFIPSIGYFPQASKFAFEKSVNDISSVLESDRAFIIFKLDSISPVGIKELSKVEFQISNNLKLQKQREASELLSLEIYNKINIEKESLKFLSTKDSNLKYLNQIKSKLNKPFKEIGKNESIIGSLLAAESGDIIGPLSFSSGMVIIELISKQKLDENDWQIKKDLLKNNLLSEKQNNTINEWVENLQKKAKIIDNRKYYF